MRILLTANASYDPPQGGSTRSNLVWLRHLESAGHECRMVCGGAQSRRLQALRGQILEWRPDWVLVSSEDLGHALLREAHHSAPGRVVYLAHTPQFYPFGPASWNPDPRAAELVARSAGIVAIGRHMADYIERALGRRPAVIHPPIYGAGPFANYGNFERGLIAHDQSLRGEGHFDFSRNGGAAARVRVRGGAGMGHHSRGRACPRALAQRALSAQRRRTSMKCWRKRACC